MIRLKLDLKEATVNYNETGALVGFPVEHAPNQIRNYSMPFEIVGYVSKTDFLAYSLSSSARKFTVAEQLSLLTSLGFKTVPYYEHENGNGNELITVKNQYSMYGATWISLPSGKEFKVPELAHVNTVAWKIGQGRSVAMVVTTDKGVFDVYDMKLVAYFQPGCTAKVWNGELQPMNTAPIVVPVPSNCPKCNNPLKRVQIYPDLPLFYKCTSSICDLMVLDEPTEEVETAETEISEEAAEPDSFRREIVAETSAEPVSEEFVSDTAVTEESEQIACLKCYVDEAKIEGEEVDALVAAGKIEVVDNADDADVILVKSKLAVSKAARAISKDKNIDLKPITDFED